jgi:hypothetical protein
MPPAQAHYYPPIASGYFFGTRQRTHPLGVQARFFKIFRSGAIHKISPGVTKRQNSRSVKLNSAGPLSARTQSAVTLKPLTECRPTGPLSVWTQ